MSDLASADWLEGAMIVNEAVARIETHGVSVGKIARHVLEREDRAHETLCDSGRDIADGGQVDDQDESNESEEEREGGGKRPRIDSTNEALDKAGHSLKEAVHVPSFCCGGSITIDKRKKQEESSKNTVTQARDIPVLQIRTDASAEWMDAGTILDPDMNVLLKISKPATFGDLKTQTTKFDETVRKALDLQPDCWRCFSPITTTTTPSSRNYSLPESVEEPPPETVEVRQLLLQDDRNIIERIEQDINGHMYQDVHLVPHKMNIYSEGGFFKAHVDTPIHSDMMGTVVISLPVPHKGGNLEISHGEATHNAEFAIDKPDSKLRWVAFYGDCKHEVKPVLEGHRVTITFTMLRATGRRYRVPSNESYAGPVDPSSALTYMHELPDFLLQMDRAHNKVGIILSQKYTLGGLHVNGLKGLDKYIYEALKTRFECALKSVVVQTYYSAYRTDPEFKADFKVCVYDFDRSEILRLLGKSAEPKPVPQDRKFLDMAGGTLLKHWHQVGADHAGNEAIPETIEATYLGAALLLN